ncbi:formate dehydrogenase accessory sulfurtransferase FdhD [Roseomonas sp. M0104]|uniref:Sulfur carrier protein FdhD n=1 Tax=Teichococcus coralli TaxID=2545983 RepID=A0A845BFH6_9PROT|nr:formate dehydrogenase accessory sulfurtransferase FdhD [Pseudoroseomonas coralli]MXP65608.1 formate dehydrogenase accessory sulfurtransferase FdhD [Pseudoroseomonas coralli]
MATPAWPRPSVVLPCLARRPEGLKAGLRAVPEETAVALTYGSATHAVMMATPADLPDLGLGFSLTEGLIAHPGELTGLEVLPRPAGIEIRMELAGLREEAFARRRRRLAGPLGCGLCGIESLDEATRDLPRVAAPTRLSAAEIGAAMTALADGQALHRETHAVHAAGFWRPGQGLVALREDVGRHNALDKLAGALLRQGRCPAEGAVVLTSRVSVEMVQKTALLGAPLLLAVSAPTALAVRVAEGCGITLVARVRGEGFEVFSHPQRIA